MKTLRSLAALLSKIVWTGVLVILLMASSLALCLLGHPDYAIVAVLWAVLIVQISIAERR